MKPESRLQRLDLHSLRLFAIVAKDGSITRAAERNHIAASALSRRLAELEHLVGARLLVRSRKGVDLTEAGRIVLQHADRIHDEARSLLRAISAAQEATPTVRLCASHSVVGGILPELLGAFRPGAEQVRVEISEASSREVIAACEDGRAEIGIGLGVRAPLPDGLEAWSLWTDRLQVLMREDHFLARAKGVRFEQVLAFPVIGSNPAGALSEQLRQEADALGIAYIPRVTAANFSASCRLAASGLGIAIMPRTAVPAGLDGSLVQQPLLEPWAQRPVKVYASAKRSCPGAAALLQHLRARSQVLSTLRQEPETLQPGARLEPKFTVAPLLPAAREPALDRAAHGRVRVAEVHEP
jgi:DNA-binding transcriptional LysR family regulator